MHKHRCHRFVSRHTAWYGTVALVFAFLSPGLSIAIAGQVSDPPLYTCLADSETVSEIAGVQLCTAEQTATLVNRAETDNLQMRLGALVSRVETAGIGATAGLIGGDVIYRIGGNDVAEAGAAAEQLDMIGTSADTVVNFLRKGRPYRIKLRR